MINHISFDKDSFTECLPHWEKRALELQCYPTDEDLLDAFCQTLFQGCYRGRQITTEVTQFLRKSYIRCSKIFSSEEHKPETRFIPGEDLGLFAHRSRVLSGVLLL
jgi:hypothetical protein